MKTFNLSLLLCLALIPSVTTAENFLVENGEPRAEIVIAEKSPRATRLAAQELQTYLRKISGAKLDIVTTPGRKMPVRIFVGQSAHTEKLGITTQGLK